MDLPASVMVVSEDNPCIMIIPMAAEVEMFDQKTAEGRGKDYYYAQVDFYLNAGETGLALHQANRNIAYNEEDPVAYINRARVFEKLGELEKARLDLEEALRLAPDNQEAISFLGRIGEG